MSLLFPDKCIFCGKPIESGKQACIDCVKSISLISGDVCEICGMGKDICTCKLGDFAFNRNISVFYYDGYRRGPISSMVKRMKFQNLPQLAKYMTDMMWENISVKYEGITFDYVTFVPMNKLKKLKKGFDHAEILAMRLSKMLGVPGYSMLVRKFNLKAQKFRKVKDRRAGVRGEYILKANIPDIRGKNILIIDDILTTGASISECALQLKKAGANQVMCATFAITCKK